MNIVFYILLSGFVIEELCAQCCTAYKSYTTEWDIQGNYVDTVNTDSIVDVTVNGILDKAIKEENIEVISYMPMDLLIQYLILSGYWRHDLCHTFCCVYILLLIVNFKTQDHVYSTCFRNND